MEIRHGRKNGNTWESTTIHLNGPIGSIMGVILSVLSLLGSLLFLGIVGFFLFLQISTLPYQPTQATVVRVINEEENQYEIVYLANDKPYQIQTDLFEKNEIGKTIDIFYNPKNPEEITFEHSVSFLFILIELVLIFIIVRSIRSLKRNVNNFRSFFHPNQYPYDNSEESSLMGDAINDFDSPNHEETEDGSYTQFRF